MQERLKEIRRHFNMTQAEFAKKLGIGQSTLAMMEVNKRDLSDRHVKTICAICGISEEWLRTGAGPMFSQDTVFSLDQFVKDRGGTDLELEIVKAYFSLPTEIRETVIGQFKAAFMKTLTPAGPDERTELHAELDRQMNLEKEAAEKSEAYSSTG